MRQKRARFTEKDARETLANDYERSIWIAVALSIPEARKQIAQLAFQDEQTSQLFVEEAFRHEVSKRQILTRLFQDDEVMREQLGEELYLLWKARQQSNG